LPRDWRWHRTIIMEVVHPKPTRFPENYITYISEKNPNCVLRTPLESIFFILMTIFRAKFGSVVYIKFTIRFRMLIRRILSRIMKIWVQPLLWPIGRGWCGHSLFFVLDGKKTNKSFKDTMSLNGIDHKKSRWEYLNPVIGPTSRHFRLCR
jgi:hypothetical protein